MNRGLGLLCLAVLAGCSTSRVMAWNNSSTTLTVRIQAAATTWEGVIAPASVACFTFRPQGEGGFSVATIRSDGTRRHSQDVDYFTESVREVHVLEITATGDVLARVYRDYRDRLHCRN